VTDTFSVLSRELTKAERKLLLARILSSEPPAGEEPPPASPPPEEIPLDAERAYTEMPSLQKLILLLKRLFTGKTVVELTEAHLLRQLRTRVELRAPGLMDPKTGRLTPRMRAELETLRAPLTFFRSTLAGLTGKRDFVAFLAGILLDPLNERIALDSDPFALAGQPLYSEDRAIRSEMADRLARLLDEIPRERRARVQREVHRLDALGSLGTLRLEDAVFLTAPSADALQPAEKAGRLRPLLEALTEAREAPDHAAWNAVFLYRASDHLADPAFDIEKQAGVFLTRASAAHAALRGFLGRVPLLDVIRLLSEDLRYAPHATEGGESWMLLFRTFWEERLEDIFRSFLRERRLREVLSDALSLCGLPALPSLDGYRQRGPDGPLPARFASSLAVFRGFYETVYLTRVERHMKIVSINGEFYKENNRDAFTECLEGLEKAYRACALLDRRLSPGGDLAARAAASAAEPGAAGRPHSVWDEANKEAKKIADAGKARLTDLSRILYGILYGEVGGQYDTLVNLNTIGGRENKLLLKALDSAIGYSDKAAALLGECLDLEAAGPSPV
jgi:hypothetical protein